MGMRKEIKINISFSDYMTLKSRLKVLFQTDRNTDAHGTYRVRSIYFDNLYDKVLLEKINGDRYKEKFRIRCYNNDYSFIRLEKKVKVDSVCAKTNAKLTEAEVRSILQGETIDSSDPLVEELYKKMQMYQLRPKTIVDYKREPFVYAPGNVRITLDTDLRTGLGSTDFLNPDLLLIPAAEEYGLMEVKYDEFLPDIVKSAIFLSCRRQTANSKYAICRRFD